MNGPAARDLGVFASVDHETLMGSTARDLLILPPASRTDDKSQKSTAGFWEVSLTKLGMKIFVALMLLGLCPRSVQASLICDHLAFLISKQNMHSTNIANAETTRTLEGGPFRKLELNNCIEWRCEVVPVDRFKQVYWPEHPDAEETGFVRKPDIDTVVEIKSLIETQMAYESLIAGDSKNSHECGDIGQ